MLPPYRNSLRETKQFLINILDEPKDIYWIRGRLTEKYPEKKYFRKPSYIAKEILDPISVKDHYIRKIDSPNETLYVRNGDKLQNKRWLYARKFDVSDYEVEE